jgi:hypothetical protein
MICRYNVERKIIPIYVLREKNSDFAEHGIDSSLKVKCLVSKRIVHFKRKITKTLQIFTSKTDILLNPKTRSEIMKMRLYIDFSFVLQVFLLAIYKVESSRKCVSTFMCIRHQTSCNIRQVVICITMI